jgi:site-specific recombinase XerC
MSLIAPTLQSFFTDRLVNHRRVSPRTIASYRDSLRMLVMFVQERTRKPASALDWQDLPAVTIGAFLDRLEAERGNSARTRNLRLTAIRSCSPTPRCTTPSTPR